MLCRNPGLRPKILLPQQLNSNLRSTNVLKSVLIIVRIIEGLVFVLEKRAHGVSWLLAIVLQSRSVCFSHLFSIFTVNRSKFELQRRRISRAWDAIHWSNNFQQASHQYSKYSSDESLNLIV